MRIGLLACATTTADDDGPRPARELYDSPLFRARRAHVEAGCDRWFVLSPRYGLVAPDELVEPEARRLVDLPAAQRAAWADAVVAELTERVGPLAGAVVEIHAGEAFCGCGLEEGLRRHAASVTRPVRGLGQGKQLAWYRQARRHTASAG